MLTLDRLSTGKAATIARVADGSLKVRLTDMGLYAGREVQVLFKAPFGDPIAVDVGDYVVSLRIDEAQMIEVHSD